MENQEIEKVEFGLSLILDIKNKKLEDKDTTRPDSFVDAFNEEVKNKKLTLRGTPPDFSICADNVEIVKIENKSVVEVNFPNVTSIGSDFMRNTFPVAAKKISLPKVETVGNAFLGGAINLQKVSLPNLKKVGDYFLHYPRELKEISLPKLENAGNVFLFNPAQLQKLSLPNLKTAGEQFLFCSAMEKVSLPKLESVGERSIGGSFNLQKVSLPRLKSAGKEFLTDNPQLQEVYVPNLKGWQAGNIEQAVRKEHPNVSWNVEGIGDVLRNAKDKAKDAGKKWSANLFKNYGNDGRE